MKSIGKYRIRGLLGRGGMAKVYKAEIPVIKKIVALKQLSPAPVLETLLGAAELHRLFIKEATTMAQLRHPHLLGIWDFQNDGQRPFYTMEYHANNLGLMIGETYRTEMPSRIIRLDRAIDYTRQILSGLACLHHAGIIHRDIKPFNILLTDRHTVKIGDFGLSKLRKETLAVPPNLKVGSPWYASPEQEANPDKAAFSADLYSVGVMLWRMLAGRLPEADTGLPSRLNPDLDDAWDRFLARATAADPERRFATAGDMRSSLEYLAAEWSKRKSLACRLPSPEHAPRVAPAGDLQKRSLRSRALKVGPRDARSVFGLDPLWRPRVYLQNRFRSPSAETVADDLTDLLWQRSGTPYALTWRESHGHILRLNQSGWQGRRDWRLPTVDELLSLLEPPPHGEDFCLQGVFDQRQTGLWSSDRRSYTAAWFASVDLGFVAWQDFSAACHVRAVCSL
jgi:serine/threonine-protein kinase